jgi:hypothetical protein
MTRPVVHLAAEQAYRLLPDFMRAADETTDYAALRFVGGLAVTLESASDLLTMSDPATSLTGTNELVNAQAIPRAWLPWLGWLVGIDVTSLPVEDARDIVAGAGESQRRGSRNAIKAAVARTLSSQSPPPRVWANLSGTDPYLISVVTNTAQTPDEAATLLAAEGEKPAGMVIELQTVAGAVVLELEAAFTTIPGLEAEFATVADLDAWIPTT